MTARAPALVAISHGTSSELGRAAVRALRDAVAAAVSDGPPVLLGHVDVEQPDVAATLGALDPGEPAVIVPLLLSAGYHVHVDLTDAVHATRDRPVTLAGALGPDDRLIDVMRSRCREAGVRDDDVLVLAVAGSSDARAVRDCHATAERFSAVLGREVRIGFLSAAAPRLPDAIAEARTAHPEARIVAVSYLLAQGFFQDLIEKAGADVVTPPLLIAGQPVPRPLVQIVLDRYAAASGA